MSVHDEMKNDFAKAELQDDLMRLIYVDDQPVQAIVGNSLVSGGRIPGGILMENEEVFRIPKTEMVEGFPEITSETQITYAGNVYSVTDQDPDPLSPFKIVKAALWD